MSILLWLRQIAQTARHTFRFSSSSVRIRNSRSNRSSAKISWLRAYCSSGEGCVVAFFVLGLLDDACVGMVTWTILCQVFAFPISDLFLRRYDEKETKADVVWHCASTWL